MGHRSVFGDMIQLDALACFGLLLTLHVDASLLFAGVLRVKVEGGGVGADEAHTDATGAAASRVCHAFVGG